MVSKIAASFQPADLHPAQTSCGPGALGSRSQSRPFLCQLPVTPGTPSTVNSVRSQSLYCLPRRATLDVGLNKSYGKTPRGLGSGSIALADSVGVRNRRLGRIVSGSEIAPRARSACQSVSSELQNAFNVRILNASKHSGPQPEKFLPLEDASFPTSSQCPQTQLPGDSGEGETVVTVCKDLRLRRDTRDLSLWLWPVFLALVTLRHS